MTAANYLRQFNTEGWTIQSKLANTIELKPAQLTDAASVLIDKGLWELFDNVFDQTALKFLVVIINRHLEISRLSSGEDFLSKTQASVYRPATIAELLEFFAVKMYLQLTYSQEVT